MAEKKVSDTAPEITTTGYDAGNKGSGYGHSKATVTKKGETISVDTQYSLATTQQDTTSATATITSTQTKGNKTTEDETRLEGKIDLGSGTMSFKHEQTTKTTEQLADGGKRVQGNFSGQGSRLADNLVVAKGLDKAGNMNNLDNVQATYDITYDAQGQIISEERHVKSPSGGYRSDVIVSYDNKGQLKEEMHAQSIAAETTFSHQKGTLELANAGDEAFRATLWNNGSASYEIMKNKSGDKAVSTTIDIDSSGKVTGYTIEQRKDVATNMWTEAKSADRRILSAKEADKLRKKMQKRGNQISQKVSGQNMENYKQEKQSYNSIGGSEYFRKQSPEVEAAYKASKEASQEIAGAVDGALRQVTPKEASAILTQAKLDEMRGK